MAAERAVLQSERAEQDAELAALKDELLRLEQEAQLTAAERLGLQETLTETERERGKVRKRGRGR